MNPLLYEMWLCEKTLLRTSYLLRNRPPPLLKRSIIRLLDKCCKNLLLDDSPAKWLCGQTFLVAPCFPGVPPWTRVITPFLPETNQLHPYRMTTVWPICCKNILLCEKWLFGYNNFACFVITRFPPPWTKWISQLKDDYYMTMLLSEHVYKGVHPWN